MFGLYLKMKSQMTWHLLALAGFIWFALSMLTAVDAQERSNGRYVLPLILMCQAILLLFAAIIVWKANIDKVKVAWPSLDKGGRLIFVGFTIIYLTILARLLCFSHFGGSVGSFSFGLKCDGEVCEENEAFSWSFNSFGHTIQGGFSFFLFSDILIGGLRDRWGKSQGWEKKQTLLLCMKEYLGICSCLYPIYNVLKRAILEADNFSTSSFWNNGSEWACGFAIGTCAIYSYYAIIYYSLPVGLNVKERFHKLEILRDGKQYLRRLRIAAGIVLILVALLSIILLATTWNFEPQSHVDDSEDFLTILLLISLLLIILALVTVFLISSQGIDRGFVVQLDKEKVSGSSVEMVNIDSNVEMVNIDSDVEPGEPSLLLEEEGNPLKLEEEGNPLKLEEEGNPL